MVKLDSTTSFYCQTWPTRSKGWTSSQSSTCSYPPHPPGPVCLNPGLHPPVRYPTGPPSPGSSTTQVNPLQGSPHSACQPAAQQVDMTPFPSQVDQLLKEFPGLLSSGNSTPYPKHGIQHVIKTTGHPVFAEARRLDPDKLKTDKKEFRKLESAGAGAGVIPRSDSPWADVLLRRGFPRPKTTFF